MNLLQLIPILGLVVAIAGFGCRVVARRIEPVTFRDTSPDYAGVLVAQFAEGTFENRFGFPTGFYHLDDKRTSRPERFVYVEAQPQGSITDGCAMNIGAAGSAGLGEGVAGCVWFVGACIVAAPFVVVSVVDRLYRTLMRSRIQIDVKADGADSTVSLAFYGISGYLLMARYRAAFAPPELPEGLAPVAAAEAVAA